MVRLLEFELGHLTFDATGIGPVTTRWEPLTDNIAQQALVEPFMLGRINQLEFGNGGPNEVDGLDETEAIRVKIGADGGLVHDRTNHKMGKQGSIQLLNDPNWVQGTQRTRQQTLVNLEFIKGNFDFPAFVEQHNQV